MLITILGLLAATMTSLSYVPQVRKALPKGSTDDLSFRTLIILGIGLSLWILYGVLRSDLVVTIANMIGDGLVAMLLALKIRDRRGC